jgi:short subunit dehydrogenase-like uncharacterized protein
MNFVRSDIILYGSYGYTGQLIAQQCKNRKLNVILSGRNAEALRMQSQKTGYPFQVVNLSESDALRALLQKGKVLIHCGGPFQFTAVTMLEMCLQSQTHYTDITGEYQVFEMLAGYDGKGKSAGITIMPGTGFDVVPSDCLAVYLKQKLPAARNLSLAFKAQGGLSRGTASTMIEGLGHKSVVRENGKLIEVPMGDKVRYIDFGPFASRCLNIPWGDIVTAWHSTRIPNIEVYMSSSKQMIAAAKATRYLNWLLSSRWLKNLMRRRIAKTTGPDERKRGRGKAFLWGKVWDDSGNSYTAGIETINGYALTAKTSVLIAEKILKNDFRPGFQTPGGAYGADLILEIEGTIRKDL